MNFPAPDKLTEKQPEQPVQFLYVPENKELQRERKPGDMATEFGILITNHTDAVQPCEVFFSNKNRTSTNYGNPPGVTVTPSSSPNPGAPSSYEEILADLWHAGDIYFQEMKVFQSNYQQLVIEWEQNRGSRMETTPLRTTTHPHSQTQHQTTIIPLRGHFLNAMSGLKLRLQPKQVVEIILTKEWVQPKPSDLGSFSNPVPGNTFEGFDGFTAIPQGFVSLDNIWQGPAHDLRETTRNSSRLEPITYNPDGKLT